MRSGKLYAPQVADDLGVKVLLSVEIVADHCRISPGPIGDHPSGRDGRAVLREERRGGVEDSFPGTP
jgi:hypothetical protein